MRTHFKDCDIFNPVCQFEVATITFTKNARAWWDAHSMKRPNLLVTYEQLLEWMRHELVPDSNPALPYMEWNTLRFRGNVEDYMKQIERLMEYFPIQRDTMIACLAKPISLEFTAELRNMDIRLEGMSNPKLKEVIKNHLVSIRNQPAHRQLHQDRQIPRFDPDRRHQSGPIYPNRHDVCIHAATKETTQSNPKDSTPSSTPSPKGSSTPAKPFPRPAADPAHTYLAAKYGEGPTPCYVCGTKQHGWLQCPKKKRGKCGVCGSEAHWTRYCRQCFHPQPQARLNFQTLCLEALSNPEIHLMNTPFDNDESDIEDGVHQCEEQVEAPGNEDIDNAVSSEVSLCQVAVPLPQKLPHCPYKPSEEMQSAVSFLDSDVMQRWGHFLKKVCIDASTSIFPVTSPSKKGQLLYKIEVDRVPVVALLDHGASHSFMSKDWAFENQMPLKPLKKPFQFSFFNGTHDSITHLAYSKAVRIGTHSRPWTFFVVSSTPMPVVLGLDAIRGWPLFYSPLDDRLFIIDDLSD